MHNFYLQFASKYFWSTEKNKIHYTNVLEPGPKTTDRVTELLS